MHRHTFLLVVALFCSCAVLVRGGRGLGQEISKPPTYYLPEALASKFTWYGDTDGGSIGNDIFASLDVCKNGNGGIRDVSFSQCTQICLSIPNCKVVAYYPVWFTGPSACFSKDQTMVPKLRGSTGSKPIWDFEDKSYWGYKLA